MQARLNAFAGCDDHLPQGCADLLKVLLLLFR